MTELCAFPGTRNITQTIQRFSGGTIVTATNAFHCNRGEFTLFYESENMFTAFY